MILYYRFVKLGPMWLQDQLAANCQLNTQTQPVRHVLV